MSEEKRSKRSELLDSMLEDLLNKARSGAEILSEETPKTIKEMVVYNRAESMVTLAWTLIGLIVSLWILYHGWNSDQPSTIPRIILGGVGSMVSFIATGCALSEMLKSFLSPRLVVIENLKDLIK